MASPLRNCDRFSIRGLAVRAIRSCSIRNSPASSFSKTPVCLCLTRTGHQSAVEVTRRATVDAISRCVLLLAPSLAFATVVQSERTRVAANLDQIAKAIFLYYNE